MYYRRRKLTSYKRRGYAQKAKRSYKRSPKAYRKTYVSNFKRRPSYRYKYGTKKRFWGARRRYNRSYGKGFNSTGYLVQRPSANKFKVTEVVQRDSMNVTETLNSSTVTFPKFKVGSTIKMFPDGVDDRIALEWDQYQWHKLVKIQVVVKNLQLSVKEYGGKTILVEQGGTTFNNIAVLDLASGNPTNHYAAYTGPHDAVSPDAYMPSPCRLQNMQVTIPGRVDSTQTQSLFLKSFPIKYRKSYYDEDVGDVDADEMSLVNVTPKKMFGWSLNANPTTNKWISDNWTQCKSSMNKNISYWNDMLVEMGFYQQRIDLTNSSANKYNMIVPHMVMMFDNVIGNPSHLKDIYPSGLTPSQTYSMDFDIVVKTKWMHKTATDQ